jgi:hypothetical protein
LSVATPSWGARLRACVEFSADLTQTARQPQRCEALRKFRSKDKKMSREMFYREDLEPLCPVDYIKMHRADKEPLTFKCIEEGCNIHWNRLSGYFYPYPQDIAKRAFAIDYLKMDLAVEHGYLYFASIDPPGRMTWRCSVKDCPNVAIENYPSDLSE